MARSRWFKYPVRYNGTKPIRGHGVPLPKEVETPDGDFVRAPVDPTWSERLAARLQAARAARKGGAS
jgi:hypothetical protein